MLYKRMTIYKASASWEFQHAIIEKVLLLWFILIVIIRPISINL